MGNEIGLENSIKSCDLYYSYCHKYTPCKMDMVMGYSGLAENFSNRLNRRVGDVGMTDRERAIVMAYTGVVMLCGDKLDIFYKYVSEKLGRPIWTHEFASQADVIKELSKEDFFSLCAGKPYPRPELGKGAKQNE